MVSTLEIPIHLLYPAQLILNMDTNYETSNSLFLNILSLCSVRRVRDQLSYPHITTGKIIVMCILIFGLLDRRRVDKLF
jgi:hypothetical protein